IRDLPVGKLAHGPQRSDQLGLAHRPSLSVCFTNAAKDMAGIVPIASRYGFAETVTRLRSEIERRQLTLFIAIDQHQDAAGADLHGRHPLPDDMRPLLAAAPPVVETALSCADLPPVGDVCSPVLTGVRVRATEEATPATSGDYPWCATDDPLGDRESCQKDH